ncbi:uncharacterized protein LOC118792415 [Megalops cyprinoides]|uniref:uncharacterized protein LOC118792415 n=1 Tax=Megalops cyprinoides TaxID=118141 RepID=UPI001864C1F2|nr:uncharacterized protein LOC118792415 [Megalops cyprinoides]
MQRIPIECEYIRFGGQFGGHHFSNTCVLDSLLAGIHIAAAEHLHIADLFKADLTISAVMTLLDYRKYDEAKALWLINLDLHNCSGKLFMQNDHIDIRGYVKDHLPNFMDLTCAKYHYDEDRNSPNVEDHIYNNMMSKFEHLGAVRALGTTIQDPKLILVDADGRLEGFPPRRIIDHYSRIFNLQFLLLGVVTHASNHMVLCSRLDGNWLLYDDTSTPLFRTITLPEIKAEDYVVYLAAYVNVPTENSKQD